MPDANRGIPYEASPSKRSKKALIQRVLQEAGIGVALLLLIVVFSVAAPHFTDESNITNILTQITINLIMATGMTFVILIGGIDLSVGSVMALCAMVAGLVLKSESLPIPVAIAAAVLVSVFVGMVCGFVNGLVSSFWNVPSFIVTLGMLNIARGAAMEVTDARTLFEFPNVFNEFGTATMFGVPADSPCSPLFQHQASHHSIEIDRMFDPPAQGLCKLHPGLHSRE